jgi:hypothetical protein
MLHNSESATTWNLKQEWWGVPLFQGHNYLERTPEIKEVVVVVVVIPAAVVFILIILCSP